MTRSPMSIPSSSKEILYETPKQGFIRGIGDYDDNVTQEYGAQTEENENFGTVASAPRRSIRFLDTIRCL